MAGYYDKEEIKAKLTDDLILDIVYELNGDPQPTSFGFLSRTICHNGDSHKLYYYSNTKLFRCYTECDETFDILELISKVNQCSLYESMCWVCGRYGWESTFTAAKDQLEDWKILNRYEQLLTSKEDNSFHTQFKIYDESILKRLSYPKITPWINEGIKPEVLSSHKIGYYPGGEQITIPHYNINNEFIGLRGRALGEDEAELYGKYRPVTINGMTYNHPLGLNLYNLNNSKDNIKICGKALVVEGEKSTLLYSSYFGQENDISVACCGFSLSAAQVNLLLECGAKEIIIAFDKQFKERGDEEFQRLVKKLINLNDRYKQYITLSFIFDKENLLKYKSSPLDEGVDKFLYLYKKRILL